ncbi:unnamed protein product [Boreogadus saida]
MVCCLLLFLHYNWLVLCSRCCETAPGQAAAPSDLGLVVRGTALSWDPQVSVEQRGLSGYCEGTGLQGEDAIAQTSV